MPVAEIAAAVTGIRSAFDITKAMVGLRDVEAFRAKSIELQGVVLEALEKSIEARESYATQNDRVRALEAEVSRLKAWDAEKQRYGLKSIGQGTVAYILKPDARSGETPHWLCPNCFAKGEKAFLQNTGRLEGSRLIVRCNNCSSTVPVNKDVSGWAD
jgi:hypothetical protein